MASELLGSTTTTQFFKNAQCEYEFYILTIVTIQIGNRNIYSLRRSRGMKLVMIGYEEFLPIQLFLGSTFFHAAVKNLLRLFVCNTFKHVVSYCNCLQSLVDPFKSGVRLKQLKITIISNILIEKDHIAIAYS